MDRPIIYTEEQGRGYDISKGWQDAFISVGQLVRDILSYLNLYTNNLIVVAGCIGTQTSPASLSINIGSGGIYGLGICDPSPEGDLPADGTSRVMQGQTAGTTVALSTSALLSGQSQWALVQAIFAFNDIVRVGDPSGGVLPFYNAANPTSPLQGQGGSGAVLNTEHQATVSFNVIYGTPATTGSQVPPSATAGYVGLYLILLTYGQTTITTAQILTAGPSVGTGVPSNYPYAPFLAGLLSSHHSGNPGQAPKINLATEVQGILPSANFLTTGTFTASATGFSGTAPTPTCSYVILGSIVALSIPTFNGTSNSTSFGLSGLPSAIQPSSAKAVALGYEAGEDNSAGCELDATVQSTITFSKSGGPFTASGTKGILNSLTMFYSVP